MSFGPYVRVGRTIAHSSPLERTTASSAAFARTYGVSASGEALTTLTWTTRLTSASRAAASRVADRATAPSKVELPRGKRSQYVLKRVSTPVSDAIRALGSVESNG